MNPISVALWCLVYGSTLPKGVNPRDASRYEPDGDGMFSCIGDPSIKIPFDRVNDDYCDCPDGSDEPGTSACKNGRFWCENEGYFGSFVPSSYVNDGKCDYELCCDGSDEKPGLCPNKCKELKVKYVDDQKEKARILDEGLKARELLIITAANIRQELQNEISANEKQLELKKSQLQDAEKNYQHLKSLEQSGGLGDAIDPQLEEKFEAARFVIRMAYGMISELKAGYEAEKLYSEKLSTVLSLMKKGYNPNFNDAAVKQALNSFEDISGNQEPKSGELENMLAVTLDVNDALEYVDALYTTGDGSSTTSPAKSYWEDITEQAVDWLVDHHVLPARRSSKKQASGSSKKVKDAQDLIEKVKKDIDSAKKNISSQKENLNTEKGPDDVFRAIDQVCVKDKYGEYDYEMCFFGQTYQRGNGQSSLLGRYHSYEFKDEVLVFAYNNGAKCWNGPDRSATVNVRCGDANRILKVAETEKCIYTIDMLSPAACVPKRQGEVENSTQHDEL